MNAWYIVEPGRMEIRELPTPEPGPGEVRLRLGIVGYCGSDLSTYRGANPLVSYPRIPGHELGGVIDAVGRDVSGWAVGQRALVVPYTNCGTCSACRQGRFNTCRHNQTLGVQRDGGLADYLVVPAAKLLTSPKLSLPELALVEPLTVGFHAVDRGAVAARDTVAVFGCGAIGLGAIAGAAARGARVIAIDVDDAKLATGRAAGAQLTLNSRVQPLHETLQQLTHGDGPEVLIEAAGRAETFRACVEESCFAGRVVYIGYAAAPVEYATKLFVQRELDIRGSRNATPADFQAVVRLLESGTFPVSTMITHRAPFSEAGAAMAMWNAEPARVTKIQIEVHP